MSCPRVLGEGSCLLKGWLSDWMMEPHPQLIMLIRSTSNSPFINHMFYRDPVIHSLPHVFAFALMKCQKRMNCLCLWAGNWQHSFISALSFGGTVSCMSFRNSFSGRLMFRLLVCLWEAQDWDCLILKLWNVLHLCGVLQSVHPRGNRGLTVVWHWHSGSDCCIFSELSESYDRDVVIIVFKSFASGCLITNVSTFALTVICIEYWAL